MSKKKTIKTKTAKPAKTIIEEKLAVTPENINFLLSSGRHAEGSAMLAKHEALLAKAE